MKVLIKMTKDWADEFDCEALYVCKDIHLARKIVDYLVSYDSNHEWYFGTNESLMNFRENEFSIIPITEDQYSFLKDSNLTDFGTGNIFSGVIERMCEDGLIGESVLQEQFQL